MTTSTLGTDKRPVAIVTGGSSGIGFATARVLLDAGWRVAFFSQNAERVDQAKAELIKDHASDHFAGDVVDLRNSEATRAFIGKIARDWGRLDAMVCNAGFSPKGPNGRVPLAEVDLDEWEDVLRINLTGALVCCQAAIPHMSEAGHGRVIIIGSLAARTTPRIAGSAYTASKAALAGLCRSIVSEYSDAGITANLVAPGRILSEMTGSPDSEANLGALSRIPINRLGRPEDIARVVEFLVRPESDFINGAIIDVNGGEFTPA